MSIYIGAKTAVRTVCGNSNGFEIYIGAKTVVRTICGNGNGLRLRLVCTKVQH